MPYLTVYTNVKFENEKKLAEKGAEFIAQTLHKPIGYVVANFIYNQAMCFGRSAEDKGALVELKSIGFSNKDKLIKELTEFLSIELNISKLNYINISLVDIPSAMTASAGQTFG